MSAKGTVLKRVRQSIKANARNKNYKSAMKTAIKKMLKVKTVGLCSILILQWRLQNISRNY